MSAPVQLRLEDRQMHLIDAGRGDTRTLAIGPASWKGRWPDTGLPSAYDIEMAIIDVEDQLQTLHGPMYADRTLWSAQAEIGELARAAGAVVSDDWVLQRAAIERLFNRLADTIAGMPAARMDIPTTPAFAATLLIVRETLHHLGIAALAGPAVR
ncbi:MAG: hypothetical protein JO171_04000 [Paludibacterium sp.]|uniref:hypothetical protein n=1 Tax=Paludibacterium sp. TaxID=1917523 RepID=UPI0025E960A7|nr:hypothetical protein [Paludibacterium sp.]MBV8046287.1 hypothetical protein [Paludibacterium sp.]MBV8647714.1 hypothetical protein [Paludibacterium sp.]